MDVLFNGFVLGFVVELGQVLQINASRVHEIFEFETCGEGGVIAGEVFGELRYVSLDKIEGVIEDSHIMPVAIDSNAPCHELVDVIKHVLGTETAADEVFLNM